MQRSTSRILTTHTGSLPRPRELTRLYALRARGEAVAEAEIDRLGRDAVRAVVRKQRQAGIDVGNNGEQQRDSFFLYLKNRLSGLGGSWERPSRADIDRYPDFQRLWTEQHASKTQVSALGGLPKAIGAVRYLDARAINDECRVFKDVLAENPGVFAEPFMSAPSPGILATAVRNEHYDTLANYLAALGAALTGRIRSDRKSRSAVADRRSRSRTRTPHYLQGPARFGVRRFCRTGRRHDQPGTRQRAARPRAPACVLGQFRIAARLRRGAGRHSAGAARRQCGRPGSAIRQSAARPRIPLLRHTTACRAIRFWSPA